jgi:hypothetical protein
MVFQKILDLPVMAYFAESCSGVHPMVNGVLGISAFLGVSFLEVEVEVGVVIFRGMEG